MAAVGGHRAGTDGGTGGRMGVAGAHGWVRDGGSGYGWPVVVPAPSPPLQGRVRATASSPLVAIGRGR
jgi:hypothetical protein